MAELGLVDCVTELGLFAQLCSKPNAEMPRFASEKRFIHETAKQGEGRTNLKSASLKIGLRAIHGIKRQGGLRRGER